MTTQMLTLDDLRPSQLENQRVLVRVDFNLPLADGEVADNTRMVATLPTVQELIAARARVILVSHCGRPRGERDPRYTLRAVLSELERLLGAPVDFADDCVGPIAQEAAARLRPGGVLLLENLRFHGGEKKNDPAFADALASLADVFVGDAFGAAHRAHASVVGVAERLPVRAAGRLMVREVETLGGLLGEPERPFVGVLGGAKISGKIETLENLLPRLDALILGGGMANTFLAARGYDLARSLVEADRVELAGELLRRAEQHGTRVLLPTDLVVTDDLNAPGRTENVTPDAVPEGLMAVDIGTESRSAFAEACRGAGTLFWNGPLGVFEKPAFSEGTYFLARALADCPGFAVIGGGETAAAVKNAGIAEKLGHVSTGGGASLELLAGKSLPGVEALGREGNPS
ncbi:MAG: phosphoglycerate kinase [Acidobacteriota bacterium]